MTPLVTQFENVLEIMIIVDIFPQTAQPRKRLWICSLELKNSEEIHRIQTSHVECVVLMSRVEK